MDGHLTKMLQNMKHYSTNPASGRVMEKAGMIKEAVLTERRYDEFADSYCDLISYYIKKFAP